MRLMNYQQFINENHKREYGCVMLRLECNDWNRVLDMIDSKDLYNPPSDSTYGLEKDPHITLLYGIHSDVDDKKIEKIISKFKGQKFPIEILGIDCFENKDFDVVKFKVELTPQLKEINRELSKLPNSNQYPKYNPHITLGYVQPGTGEKYNNPNKRINFKIKNIEYSKPSGEKINYEI